MKALLDLKASLDKAILGGRSEKWCLTLWSRYIRARDNYRCVICENKIGIHAHHILRRTIRSSSQFQLGNGITLCQKCHRYLHSEFNGRPLPNEPLNFRGGDDQDEMAFLYGALVTDAKQRRLEQDLFYFIDDETLLFFCKFQGYLNIYQAVKEGRFTRLRGAHEIWRNMPEPWYENLASDLMQLLLLNKK